MVGPSGLWLRFPILELYKFGDCAPSAELILTCKRGLQCLSTHCLEDQLRAHTGGLGLEESPVQITGLEGLFLPPVTAMRPEGGPGAKALGNVLERVKQCPWWPFRGVGASDRQEGWRPQGRKEKFIQQAEQVALSPLGPGRRKSRARGNANSSLPVTLAPRA